MTTPDLDYLISHAHEQQARAASDHFHRRDVCQLCKPHLFHGLPCTTSSGHGECGCPGPWGES